MSKTGRKITEEHRRKLVQTHKGKKLSQKHIQIIINTHKGKKLSDEHKQILSQTHKGKVIPKAECPHCYKWIAINLFNRWHNENCKDKDEGIK
jgi:hypothetical protein